jgi:heptosyltransferase III
MLRQRYPDAHVVYFGGVRTEELWEVEPSIDRGIAVQGRPLAAGFHDALNAAPFDLVINLEASDWSAVLASTICGSNTFVLGHSMDSEGRNKLEHDDDERGRLWQDSDWTAADLTERYTCLDSGFIASIFCRLCYLCGPLPPYRVARCTPPTRPYDVIVSAAASLPEKLWPIEKWLTLVETFLRKGKRVAVVGAQPTNQNRYWLGGETEETLISELQVDDLRGKLTLPEVAGALNLAGKVVTIDNGVLHLAASTQTSTVGLFRSGIARLWTPPVATVTALTPEPGVPVSAISIEAVLEAIGL